MQMAERIAEFNRGTDSERDSQSTWWEDTRKHAMSGVIIVMGPPTKGVFTFWAGYLMVRTKTSRYQTPEEAKAEWQKWIDQCMAKAEKGDVQALGNAMHAAQDRWARGHQFKEWDGHYTLDHLLGDASPSDEEAEKALAATVKLAKQFAAKQCK
jgi:hypothetical protein